MCVSLQFRVSNPDLYEWCYLCALLGLSTFLIGGRRHLRTVVKLEFSPADQKYRISTNKNVYTFQTTQVDCLNCCFRWCYLSFGSLSGKSRLRKSWLDSVFRSEELKITTIKFLLISKLKALVANTTYTMKDISIQSS